MGRGVDAVGSGGVLVDLWVQVMTQTGGVGVADVGNRKFCDRDDEQSHVVLDQHWWICFSRVVIPLSELCGWSYRG